jgi:hypothetical protein
LAARPYTTAEFGTETCLFVVKGHTIEVAKAGFVFWSEEWKWNNTKVATRAKGAFDYGFSATMEENGLFLARSAKRSAANRLEWRMHLIPSAGLYDRPTIVFQDAPVTGEAFVPQLEILTGKDGRSLKLAAKEEPVKLVISPAPANVLFERNLKHEVRVFIAQARLGTYWTVFRDAP